MFHQRTKGGKLAEYPEINIYWYEVRSIKKIKIEQEIFPAKKREKLSLKQATEKDDREKVKKNGTPSKGKVNHDKRKQHVGL